VLFWKERSRLGWIMRVSHILFPFADQRTFSLSLVQLGTPVACRKDISAFLCQGV
jgi:hypothetical protein